jgi:hypothetical protein
MATLITPTDADARFSAGEVTVEHRRQHVHDWQPGIDRQERCTICRAVCKRGRDGLIEHYSTGSPSHEKPKDDCAALSKETP